ncbi:MAG: oxygen-dependent coproporphyrinogen oxidase [Candidatus Marinimicrobia bacterium]|nr:oxygen-dependent coproporphyrinogen oxidase [Candidatus Neomarinimicrobiota bacterium]
MVKNLNNEQKQVKNWFFDLRNILVKKIENIDKSKFTFTDWLHSGKGGGTMGKINGNIIEKGGVNISTVSGKFSENIRSKIPGTEKNPSYWATGISVVLHPLSPLLPSIHFNSRYLNTEKSWFGGGMDITPSNEFDKEKKVFHKKLKFICDKHDPSYYLHHKKWCDDYFFLKHRNEPRGIGGIFFDHLNTGDFKNDFEYIIDIGNFFSTYVNDLIIKYKDIKWTEQQKEIQLLKRGRYVEFNLLYDRGTKFGIETGGNTDAILMSMPPNAKWK